VTRQRSFKLLVRSRMEKTGESYMAARAALLAGKAVQVSDRPPLVTSDEAIRRRSGRGWEEWFDLLDQWGAADRTHREIARWVAETLRIDPLVWEAQAITASYERARGLRVVGQKDDGFSVTAQRTVAVPVGKLFDAFVDAGLRERWLPGADLRERTSTKPKSAHYDWAGGPSRVHVVFVAKDAGRSLVAVEHARLADAKEAERMKASWRQGLTRLRTVLEGGVGDG
jgi:hypothetical protein